MTNAPSFTRALTRAPRSVERRAGRPLRHLAARAATLLVVAACHAGASEPSPASTASSSSTPPPVAHAAPARTDTTTASDAGDTPDPRHHVLHRIIEADHRQVIPLRLDDRIALPLDPTFDWRIDFENRSAFAPFNEEGGGPDVYRVTKAGPLRVMVYGEPKCMKSDAACTLSKRRWDIAFDVR
jgi:hypothetical protein